MKNSIIIYSIASLWLIPALYSCSQGNGEDPETPVTKTPVTVTTIQKGPIAEYQEFNASSTYLKMEAVKAPIAGYLIRVDVSLGEKVKRGQALFTLQTKEARALQSGNLPGDSTFHFSGLVRVKSTEAGVLSTLNYQQGAYVQEGDQLAQIAGTQSVNFILKVPFEYQQTIHTGLACQIVFPDQTIMNGTIRSLLPSVDQTTQAAQYLVKPDSDRYIPENLNVMVRVATNINPEARKLPKSCMLTNEIQTEFWVMKLLDDTTAIRVNIKKGIETAQEVAIDSPVFSMADRILMTGQFGLPDTALVTVTH